MSSGKTSANSPAAYPLYSTTKLILADACIVRKGPGACQCGTGMPFFDKPLKIRSMVLQSAEIGALEGAFPW